MIIWNWLSFEIGNKITRLFVADSVKDPLYNTIRKQEQPFRSCRGGPWIFWWGGN